MLAKDNSVSGGAASADEILAGERPDAIFCASDAIAHGLIFALTRRGIKLPEQMGILSVENGDVEYNTYSVPALSGVHIPHGGYGKRVHEAHP